MRARTSKFQIQQRIKDITGMICEDDGENGANEGASASKMSMSPDRLNKTTPVMISDIHKKVAKARDSSKLGLDHNASIMSNNTFELAQDNKSQETVARMTNLRAMHNSS
jgi:hypothetical protein